MINFLLLILTNFYSKKKKYLTLKRIYSFATSLWVCVLILSKKDKYIQCLSGPPIFTELIINGFKFDIKEIFTYLHRYIFFKC